MYPIIVVFIISLCLASFFHTLAVRLVDSSSDTLWQKLTVPSRCDHCLKKLSPLYLIPLAGYFFAKGRCRHCAASISPVYPVIEIVYALAMVQLYMTKGGITAESILYMAALSSAAAVTAADLKSMLIPDFFVLTMALSGAGLIYIRHNPLNAIWGALFLFGVFLLIVLFLPGSFGFGDAKYAAAIGLVAGFQGAVIVLESALIIGSLCGIAYALITRKGIRIRIPFAPFLSAGLYIAVFYEKEILLMYQSVFYNF